ncbi:hypothetical protein HAX54_028166 [Datura stramonium]|uniref:Uncharacterized protein n=1 Tax=Datura stramonium TaxID=4076 RepID=A0ABS8V6F8_DATST|nr:hypothetical protein [Datura stramonium]
MEVRRAQRAKGGYHHGHRHGDSLSPCDKSMIKKRHSDVEVPKLGKEPKRPSKNGVSPSPSITFGLLHPEWGGHAGGSHQLTKLHLGLTLCQTAHDVPTRLLCWWDCYPTGKGLSRKQ